MKTLLLLSCVAQIGTSQPDVYIELVEDADRDTLIQHAEQICRTRAIDVLNGATGKRAYIKGIEVKPDESSPTTTD